MKLKKPLSFVLALSLSLVFVLSVLIPAGVTVSFALASSTYKSELWLLCGNEYALVRGQKVDISDTTDAAPFAYESTGTAYIPIAAPATYKGASVTTDGDVVTVTQSNGSTVTLNVGSTVWSGGELQLPVEKVGEDVYISILTVNSVFGTKSIYNSDIGAIIFYEGSRSSSTSLETQINTLGSLLFDRPSASQIYSDLVSYSGSADTHPRLLATAETFDNLRTVLATPNTDKDSRFYKIYSFYSSQLSAFTNYFTVNEATGEVEWKPNMQASVRQPYYLYDENGNRLVGVSTYSYVDENGETVTLKLDTERSSGLGDGYDYGGRSSVDSYTSKLKSLALLWQLSAEEDRQKYADAFYLMAIELGKWEHWGEGHFLDCADGSVEYALGLDWIYHAFDDEPQKRAEMAEILYEKGMMMGYYAIVCDDLYKQASTASYDMSSKYQYGTHARQSNTHIHVSKRAGTSGWRTINRTNNWQTVCGSGMIISALFLTEYEEYRENANFVIEQYLYSNERCLLQYAPDGAYIESPGYWGYGTNTYMRTIAALQSSLGTDYGLSKTIGLYDSFYYTIGIANGRYYMWNYHDSGGYDGSSASLGSGRVDYSSFYLAAEIFDDPTLAYLRDQMLFGEEAIGDFTVMDVLYYSPQLSEGADMDSVALDYNFKAIDTATFRSGFGDKATFVGLHTGPNAVTHGDMDCGNFMLSMGGVKWIADPGSEDYNVAGFWETGENGRRYKLYAKSTEGHSTVVIRNNSELPRGQEYTSASSDYATIDTFYSDENGGFAITDMKTEYGSSCISGKRGVLLTNSRNTVVLQDEISFSSATDLTWILNINIQNYQNISEDGKTIRVKGLDKDGKIVTLRMTLITDNDELKFRKMGAYETVFSDTYTKTGNNDTRAKDPVPRICIEANGVTSFNVAVVFQIEEHVEEIVPYNYTNMDNWRTETDAWVKEANKDINYAGTPVYPETKLGTFKSINGKLEAAFSAGDYNEVGELLWETREYLLNYNDSNAEVAEQARKYRLYRQRYNEILRALNNAFKDLLFDK